MPNYLFFPPADEAQDAIWEYSFETWGARQAKKYIIGLHNHLQALTDKEMPWSTLPNSLLVPPDLKTDVYFSHYEHHYIFFREFENGNLGVLSILHESVDLPIRLHQDLEKISSKNQ